MLGIVSPEFRKFHARESPEMNIRHATPEDAATLAMLISESNRDVAVRFNLDRDNCPKHPSFCTTDWLKTDFSRKVQYFILEEDTRPVGCVAYEKPNSELAFLNRLSVLPEFRGRGCGSCLVRHIVARARSESVKTLSIGVIGEHADLQCWYGNLGFIDGETKRFAHLPFSVKYMTYAI